MAAVKGKDTKPELRVRRFLHGRGMRYRLHYKQLAGKPDLVFLGRKCVVFVHGCFWHGHENCKDFRVPKSRSEWWAEKIGKNVERDKRNSHALVSGGWRVLTIWECQLSDENLTKLAKAIETNVNFNP
ncbi:MAG: very short patch repair endonuclease [Parvibaculum sp.]